MIDWGVVLKIAELAAAAYVAKHAFGYLSAREASKGIGKLR